MIPKTQSSWHQITGVHRWELRQDARVLATTWHEAGHWHWSVPGDKLPQRGIKKQFRAAIKEAESAAGQKQGQC
jgi:hypothetical protein